MVAFTWISCHAGFCMPTVVFQTNVLQCKDAFHLSEPAGQTGRSVNGVNQFEGLLLRILQHDTSSEWCAPFNKSDIERFSFSVLNQSLGNCSDQSQQAQTALWTNQNSKKIHVTGAKGGKTRASKSRLVWFYILLVEKVARVFRPITERTNAKPKPTRNYFRHSIENRSINYRSNWCILFAKW